MYLWSHATEQHVPLILKPFDERLFFLLDTMVVNCEVHIFLYLPQFILLFQDNCKARIEAFGPMGGLSEEEYQAVYQTTGIDVDNRQAFITVLSKVSE